jgi:hypothetical protein
LPEFALKNWFGRSERPSLPQWLSIAYGLGLGPIEFLTSAFCDGPATRWLRRVPRKAKVRSERRLLSDDQRKAIQEQLDAAVASSDEPVSVAMLSRTLGLKRSFLTYHWPTECKRIGTRYWEVTKARTAQRIGRQTEAAKAAVDSLLANGVYPSPRKARAFLRQAGVPLAKPTIREAYKMRKRERLTTLQQNGSQDDDG